MKKIIQRFARSPKHLLIADAAGAFITFFLLFFIAENFHVQFGIPQTVLFFLSFTAFLIFGYSLLSALLLKKIYRPNIISVAIINSLYCILSLGMMLYLQEEIHLLGVIYFSVEIVMIILLIMVEYKTSELIR